MSELGNKALNLSQGGIVPFTLFEKDKISIILDLPSIVKLRLGVDESCPVAPVLKNDSPYTVISATFSISLDSVHDTNSQEVIANVEWLNSNTLETASIMHFTCENVPAGQTLQCNPTMRGYDKIQWHSTMTSGVGMEILNSSLTLGSITLGPIASETFPDTGPTINVNAKN
ncbi:hypothetical protein IF690_11120 [Pseudomonas sp. SK3(2021)]|uniref:hypothetical protein n=1 Tax=Pseudomonas sp. SK3(2021) TaxID=2841064 RepID=UPI00192C1398|nr:hypothetical protein [Pseudomonas sp. SK3(2021)]QQZ44053.1 hypothetical protein IF690_11120 [Pseudomonas sp. SK3(2021)]